MEMSIEDHSCETCKWGEWYRRGYDITMMDDECGGCCSWNDKWKPSSEAISEHLSRCKSLADYHKQIADIMRKYQKIKEIVSNNELEWGNASVRANALLEVKKVVEDGND